MVSRFHTIEVRDEKNYDDMTYSFTVPRRYSNLKFISAGSQGSVVSADDSVEKRRVAIKKMHRPFVHLISARRAYREFILLSSVKHPNIIKTYSIFTPQDRKENFQDVYIVMELMTYNLHEVVDILNPTVVLLFNAEYATFHVEKHVALDHVKLSFFIYQLLCAVNHMHKGRIIHRDLKPTNLVINENCEMKVLDFGLARLLTQSVADRMSKYVVTRYYRAPEVVLEIPYTEKVDVWSIGCICAELINRRVLFPGMDRVQIFNEIVNVLGTPKENFIARLGKESAARVRSLPTVAPKSIEEILPDHNFLSYTEHPQHHLTANDARRLISKMLEIDPNERFSVADALQDPYVRKWFRAEDVNAPMLDSRYNREIDVAGHSLEELNSIFDEVKRLESSYDVFGGL